MKDEKINFSKLESIQMCNFLMKKEIKTKLIEDIDLNNQNQKLKQKYKTLLNFFIEDLFNIINQQILTYNQIYESNEESKMENLILNNKTISFNMIINFFNKIYSLLKEKIKNNNLSRNHISNKSSDFKKYSNLIEKNLSGTSSNDKTNFKMTYTNNIEENNYKKKYKTNLNTMHNSIQSSQKNSKKNSRKNSRKNSSNNIKNIILNKNSYSNKSFLNYKTKQINKSNNIKPYYMNLNKLKDADEKEIEIFIKSQKSKKFEGGKSTTPTEISKKETKLSNRNNYNNHIIVIKQIYKGFNSSSAKKYKDYLNKEMNKKNSFNKKIKINKISIENSKIHLKNIKGKKKDNEKEFTLNDIKIKNYKPFKPRNKYIQINKIDINSDINNGYVNLTQRFDKSNYDNIDINNAINKYQNISSEKIIQNYKNTEPGINNINKDIINSSYLNKTDNNYNLNNVTPYIFDTIPNPLNNNKGNIKLDSNEKEKL